jgi:uncharacterized surface protein with fasciclin (FAS1) repeats
MNKINRFRWGMLVMLGAAVSLAGCNKDDDDNTTPAGNTINDHLNNTTNYSLLRGAVERAGWQDSLRNGNFTLFAPTDSAFQRAGITSASGFGNYSTDSIRRILRYHIVPQRLAAADIQTANNTELTSLGGSRLYVTKTAAGAVFVNGYRVVQADGNADNGVVHGINGVLAPPRGNLSQVAALDSNYTFLRAALTRADSSGTGALSTALRGTSPYTVFAPTNAAFRSAGFNSIAAINAADRATLGRILGYHVVQGRYFSNDFTTGTLTTVGGGTFNVGVNGNTIGLTGAGNGGTAATLGQGVLANNGLVYSINRVLLPSQ